MTHEAGVFFLAFCHKAAGVPKDHDEIGCPFRSRHEQAMNWGIPGRSRAMDHDPIGLNWIYDVFVDDLPANASRLSRAKTVAALHNAALRVRIILWQPKSDDGFGQRCLVSLVESLHASPPRM
ncbi:hypothetical protein V1283_006905 [Bradyrhizobium sp. AZCC 2262]